MIVSMGGSNSPWRMGSMHGFLDREKAWCNAGTNEREDAQLKIGFAKFKNCYIFDENRKLY